MKRSSKGSSSSGRYFDLINLTPSPPKMSSSDISTELSNLTKLADETIEKNNQKPSPEEEIEDFTLDDSPPTKFSKSEEGDRIATPKNSVEEKMDTPASSEAAAAAAKTKLPAMTLLVQRFPDITQLITYSTMQITTEAGPRPFFMCRVTLMGREFTGEGFTKKAAKQIMVQKAVEQLPAQDEPPKPMDVVAVDTETCQQKKINETFLQKILTSVRMKEKNPVQLLHELINGMKLNMKVKFDYKDITPENGKPHDYRCVCILTVVHDGGEGEETKEFEKKYESIVSTSKKSASNEAAKKALADQFNIDGKIFDHIDDNRLKEAIRKKNPVQAMHELCVRKGLKLEEETSTNPTPAIGFRFGFKIGDQCFIGESKVSRKDAKRLAAVRLVKEIFGFDLEVESPTTTLVDASIMPPSARPPARQRTDGPTTSIDASPQCSYIETLNRIATVLGVPVSYENVATTPKFSVKLNCGQAEAVGLGHTKDEAKSNAAAIVLRQMGLCQNHEEPAAMASAIHQPTMDHQPTPFGYSSAIHGGQADLEMERESGWMENPDDHYLLGGGGGDYGNMAYRNYQQYPTESMRNARIRNTIRNMRGPYFGNELLRRHFSRPL